MQEITNPEGYESSVEIQLTVSTDEEGNKVIVPVITKGTGSDYDEEQKYIEVDNSAKLTEVTVTKVWDDDVPESYQNEVVLELYLNGTIISSSDYDFSYDLNGDGTIDEEDVIEAQVTLNSDNNWTYTWKNLPSYVDGEVANYTVKEIQIGDTSALTNGSFDENGNWYSDDAYTQYIATTDTKITYKYDEDGNETSEVEKIEITVTNTIHLIKIDINKVTVLGDGLEGVVFNLYKYNEETEEFELVSTGTTSEDGSLSFADLEYGTKYMLEEVSTADGYYILEEKIYIQIVQDGNNSDILKIYTDETYETEVTDDYYVTEELYQYVYLSESQDSLQIVNISKTTLPKAGGIGVYWYYCLGLIIMLSTIVVFKIKNR